MGAFRAVITGCLGVIGLVGVMGARHITPTVVLAKQASVIKATVPEATEFFLRTVDIGKDDFERIREEGSFEPDDDQEKFYYGQANGRVTGIVTFPQTNTQHGPLEIGLAFNPDGTIRDAVVTKATVETKPWVLAAVRTGLLDRFKGMRPGDDPESALEGLSSDEIGAMPYYMAGVVAKTVARGLVLYDVLYD